MSTPDLFGLSAFSRLGGWLLRLPYAAFAALASVLTVIHLGFRLPWQPDDRYMTLVANWPTGLSWDSSPLWILLPKVLGAFSTWSWNLIWISMTLASLLVVIWHTPRALPPSTQRHFLVTFLASGIPLLLATRMGLYDNLFVLGVVLTVLLRSRWWILGCIITAGSNSELGIAAGLSALLVGLSLQDQSIRQRALTTVSVSALMALLTIFFTAFRGTSTDGSRLALLPSLVGRSLAANLPWFPLIVSTMFLGSWIVVLVMSFSSLQQKRLLFFLGLVGLPILLALVTLDGTRVAVSASSLAFLFSLRWWLSRPEIADALESTPGVAATLLTGIFAALILTPAVVIFVPVLLEGFFPPWESLYVLLWPL